jgi:hypothetical protein
MKQLHCDTSAMVRNMGNNAAFTNVASDHQNYHLLLIGLVDAMSKGV